MTTGYSGTPLEQKLGIRAGDRVLLDRAPAGFALGVPTLARLPRPPAELDVTLTFHSERRTLERRLPGLIARTRTAGTVWVCWPKQAAVKRLGLTVDLGEAAVRATGLAAGMVDVKIAAVDQTWSALKFVRRLADR